MQPDTTPIGRWHVVWSSGGLTAQAFGRAIAVRRIGDGVIVSIGRPIAPARVWREMLGVAGALLERLDDNNTTSPTQ